MLLDELNQDQTVGEIILIDNSLQGFEYNSDKLRIIVPNENLFVNPSWNLGVEKAKFDYIGILNDDILLPKNLVSDVYSFLQGENIGLVSGQEMAVDRVARQHHLELLHPGRQGIELFGALEVLQQNIGSV